MTTERFAQEREHGPFHWYCANPTCPMYRQDSGKGGGKGPSERMARSGGSVFALYCDECASSLYWTCGLPGQLDIATGTILAEANAEAA